jgi:cyclophilin family peptidyl-prolyl cis-trans isomerase
MKMPRSITGPREATETKAKTVSMNSVKILNCSLGLLILALVIIGALTSCGGAKNASKDFDADGDQDPALDAKVKKGVKPQADADVAVIETADFGTIVIELYSNVAPQMVERFKKLINEGFYNGTTFHRIDPELGIIQGGDPLSKDSNPDNDGTGDSPYPNVPGEMSDIPFERGIVGAARKGATPPGQPGLTEAQARDTANCQFYITLKEQPMFDNKYTVFGKVIQGLSAADAISGAPVDQGTEHPAEKIVIKNITLQPRSKFVSGS